MEIILAVIVGGLVAYIGYFLGFKIGLAMREGNNNDTAKPFFKPTKVEKVSKEEQEAAEAEKRKLDTIMENIENYDGTSFGQKDV
jgi:hypothetical protein